MSNIYCGNNANHPELLNGTQILGDRYGCLRKGIGVGRYLPYDASYLNDYAPIDNTKEYCGNNVNLPEEYNRFGTLKSCYTKGVGVGRRQKALEGPGPVNQIQPQIGENRPIMSLTSKILNIKNFILLLIFIIIFLSLYFTKPSFITKGGNGEDKDNIDIEKFTLILSVVLLVLIIISIFI